MIRLATYNVEWFANLFDQKNALINDDSWSGRYNVQKSQQIAALGHVFRTINADATMVIEAPNSGGTQSSKAALETFAKHFKLRQNTAIVGFENDTQQEIALLYDPQKVDVIHDPKGPESGAANHSKVLPSPNENLFKRTARLHHDIPRTAYEGGARMENLAPI